MVGAKTRELAAFFFGTVSASLLLTLLRRRSIRSAAAQHV
jgi:hypothetical protein